MAYLPTQEVARGALFHARCVISAMRYFSEGIFTSGYGRKRGIV